MTKIAISQGDITQQQVDAIVNAANKWLRAGGGVDGAIHQAAGQELQKECSKLGGCAEGSAKVTRGHNLPAKYIIHTVGPYFELEKREEAARILASCYRSCLNAAKELHIKTIAFPAISTGAFRYPKDEAASIAISEVKKFIKENKDTIDEIRFVLFEELNYNIYLDRSAQQD